MDMSPSTTLEQLIDELGQAVQQLQADDSFENFRKVCVESRALFGAVDEHVLRTETVDEDWRQSAVRGLQESVTALQDSTHAPGNESMISLVGERLTHVQNMTHEKVLERLDAIVQ